MTLVVCTALEQPLLRPFHKAVFLAGGITNCPDWQKDAIKLFTGADLLLFNPRRPNFPINDPQESHKQITWEHRNLHNADAVLFWFCAETIQPITLYELGAWSKTAKPIFVGVHPSYERRSDVIIQTKLTRPEVEVVSNLITLVDQVVAWSEE